MASFGASMALRALLEFVFTAEPRYFSRDIQIAIPLGAGIRVTPDQLLTLGLALVLVVAMFLLMTRTTIGRSMRAVAENPMLASVVGVDVGRVIRATWLLGGALAAAAGIMIGITVQIRPHMGFDLLLPRKTLSGKPLESVIAYLQKVWKADVAELAKASGLKGAALLESLQVGCQQGRVMYDLAAGVATSASASPTTCWCAAGRCGSRRRTASPARASS